MLLNQYIGEIANNDAFDAFIKGVKDDARVKGFPTDTLKASLKENTVTMICNGNVADLIRKRKDIKGFRCEKIGGEGNK